MADSRKTVLAFGETLWDLLPVAESAGGSRGRPEALERAVLGGAPFNFAYRVNSLGCRGVIVSRLGCDELGRRAFERLTALGMDGGYVQWDDDRPTGTVKVFFDAERNPDYYIVPGVAYDRIETEDPLLELAAAADCVCFGTLIQRAERSRRTLAALLEASRRSVKLLDINLRKDCYTPETVRLSLEEADILKLNVDEAAALAEMLDTKKPGAVESAQEMIDRWGLSCVLVTYGREGALAVSREGEAVYAPGYEVEVVDSLGSGDAFSAGFIHLRLRDRALVECLELANLMGALVATQEGATAPLTPEEIERFRARRHRRTVREDLRDRAVF